MSIIGDVLVWIDLEMDGLDLAKNFILEIACIVTDFDMKTFHEGPDLVIHHPKSLLDAMNAWCMEHHTKSGLVEQVLASKLSMSDAETAIIEFLEQVTSTSSHPRLFLAGNSVYVDRYFLEKDMPRLNAMLDRSIIDCSTIKELIHRFNQPIGHNAPLKGGNLHRALDDIRNSVTELNYYRTNAFEEQSSPKTTRERPRLTNTRQYLAWIDIDSSSSVITCILTDSHLNMVNQIDNAKNSEDLIEFFRRNRIRDERTIIVAGEHMGPKRARLKEIAFEFNEFCHFRTIDIDVVSVLCEKWFPNVFHQRPQVKQENDLQTAIELLRYYRSTIFKLA